MELPWKAVHLPAARQWSRLLVLVLSMFGCAQEGIERLVLDEAERIDAPVDLILGTTDIVTTSRGEVLLLNYSNSRIAVLDSVGSLLRTLGREGSGPGELRYPDTMRLVGDTVFVLNRPNGRLEAFLLDGGSLPSRMLPPEAVAGTTAYLPNGIYLASTGGAKGSLAVLIRENPQSEQLLGEPVAGASLPWDFVRIKQRIAEGAIPPELLNAVRPVLLTDGSAWLVVNARGAVQRYCGDGRLAWERQLPQRSIDSAKVRFFATNRAEKNPLRLHLLTPFGTARAIGTALWASMKGSEGEQTRIAVFLGPTDRLLQLEIPGVGESTRDCRRLQALRGWSHGQTNPVLSGGA